MCAIHQKTRETGAVTGGEAHTALLEVIKKYGCAGFDGHARYRRNSELVLPVVN